MKGLRVSLTERVKGGGTVISSYICFLKDASGKQEPK